MITEKTTKIKVSARWNKIFRDVNECRKRYRVLKGSAGSGKSANVAQDYIKKLSSSTYEGANLLVVRKTDETNRDSTFAELQAAVNRIFGDNASRFWRINLSPLSMECLSNHNKIIFRGMNDTRQLEKIKSITFKRGKLCWIWLEEATEFLEEDIDILDDRLRGQLNNPALFYQMTFTFNPVSAAHWIKGKFFDVKHEDIFTHHSTYLDNRFIDEAYHRRMLMRKERDPEGYRIYGLGDWGETEGLIINNWTWIDDEMEKQINYIGQDKYFDGLYYGQDFGFTHNNAIIKIGFKDGDMYVLDELIANNKDTVELITQANENGIDKGVLMFCDNAEPDRIKMWQTAGYYAVPCDKSQRIKAQIDWLKQRRIFISPKCVAFQKELTQWRWEKDKITGNFREEPINVNDDCMAAMRYATEYYRKAYPLNYKE